MSFNDDFDSSDFDPDDFECMWSPPVDYSTPSQSGRGKTLWGSNYIIAKVNGAKQVLTSAELQQLINNGYDVEVLTSH